MLRQPRRGAKGHQRKASGPISALDHSGGKARLTEGRGLLVAGHARDRHRGTEQRRVGGAEMGVVVPNLRQQRRRHPEQVQQPGVPLLGGQVEQQGAGGVGGVGGMNPAAGQPEQQKAVNGAETQFAPLGPDPRPGNPVQQPHQLGRGEIGVQQQAGARPHQRLGAFPDQRPAGGGGAPVLPDDGVVQHPAALALPQHGGLALVGDPERRHLLRPKPGTAQRRPAHLEGVLPDRLGIVFDPAIGGIVLHQFPLRRRHRPAMAIEQDRPGRGRPLVDGQNMACRHRGSPGSHPNGAQPGREPRARPAPTEPRPAPRPPAER